MAEIVKSFFILLLYSKHAFHLTRDSFKHNLPYRQIEGIEKVAASVTE